MSINPVCLSLALPFLSVSVPVWSLVFVPDMWKFMLPVSLLLSGAVLLTMLILHARRRGDSSYKPWGDLLRTLPLSWICCVISHLIAGGFLLFWGAGPTLLLGDTTRFTAWWGRNIAEPMMVNPFESIFSVLFVLLAIGLAAMLVYFFNKNMSLRLTKSLDVPEIRQVSMALALVTAPWFMLLPTVWFS